MSALSCLNELVECKYISNTNKSDYYSEMADICTSKLKTYIRTLMYKGNSLSK